MPIRSKQRVVVFLLIAIMLICAGCLLVLLYLPALPPQLTSFSTNPTLEQQVALDRDYISRLEGVIESSHIAAVIALIVFLALSMAIYALLPKTTRNAATPDA